ncbi:MAG: hypothetical protein IJT97_04440 [Bacteroidaceae bacterium]|nr:hypothetical protein [Bacteroidaceae bacterium]
MINTIVGIVAMFCIGCSGSSDSDGSNSQIEQINKILKQYAWYYSYSDASAWGEDNVDLTTEGFTLYFLDGGKGIGKFYSRTEDSYFGTSKNQQAFSFTYTVNGANVKIFGSGYLIDASYTLASEYLVSADGESFFLKSHEVSSSDREWMESVKYEILPDKERLDFNYFYSCDEGSVVNSGSSKNIVVMLCLGVEASAKVYSRKVTSLRATYTISGGSFEGKKPTTEIDINADKDYSVGTIAAISTTSKATVKATFTAYDAKNKEYVNIGSATYIVPNDNNGGGTNTSSTGKQNGHEWVDLGLSVKWATMNIGANSPEDYGGYFAWGETSTKSTYSWSTYKWGSYSPLAKYCTDSSFGTVDNKTKLELEDDAARANWGGSWRMPTDAEMTELRTKCTWDWTSQNGVNGCKVTGPNGNSIFLPAAGIRDYGRLSNAGSVGNYWSSSLDTDFNCDAYGLHGYSDDFNVIGLGSRCIGHPVRAVCP